MRGSAFNRHCRIVFATGARSVRSRRTFDKAVRPCYHTALIL